jgi:Methyltransferase domain
MNAADSTCRVCGKPAQPFFNRRLMEKYDVRFEHCPACGHVQTQPPYWLDEAYANLSFRRDVGMVDRCIWTAQTTVALAGSLGIGPQEPCLDWGAGTGMLVRLCRDYGMNYFYSDRYAKNIFAGGFEAPPAPVPGHFRLITAFEVVEHFPDPRANFEEILRLRPEFFFFSTQLYRDQGPDWWYFSEDGQHVAIYTRESLSVLARAHGYQLASDGCDIHLFSREPVSDRSLENARKKRDAWSEKYRKRHGSRLLPDFEIVKKLPPERHAGR